MEGRSEVAALSEIGAEDLDISSHPFIEGMEGFPVIGDSSAGEQFFNVEDHAGNDRSEANGLVIAPGIGSFEGQKPLLHSRSNNIYWSDHKSLKFYLSVVSIH